MLFAESLSAALDSQPDMTVAARHNSLGSTYGWLEARPEVDVLLLDNRLPDGVGIEALERIAELAPSARVIILTAFGQRAQLRRAIQAGAAGFLLKSDTMATVGEAIRNATEGGVTISPELSAQLFRVDDSEPAPVELTPRELEILQMTARGLRPDAIAEELMMTSRTVRNHQIRAMDKLKAKNRAEAVLEAVKRGLITPDS